MRRRINAVHNTSNAPAGGEGKWGKSEANPVATKMNGTTFQLQGLVIEASENAIR